MTTDNRTNEPTEAQVEAAAKAMWDLRKLISDPEWDALEYGVKLEYRKDARAALVAAQGAAPQAEQATYLNVAHSSVLAGSINARRAAREVSAMQLIDAIYDPDEDDANDSVRYGYVLEQFERLRVIYADLDDPDAGPAPVLPSSGVDEDNLAAAGASPQEPSRLPDFFAPKPMPNDYVPVTQEPSGVDEDKLAEVIAMVTDLWDDPLDEVHDIPQIARAVAAWLKDGAQS